MKTQWLIWTCLLSPGTPDGLGEVLSAGPILLDELYFNILLVLLQCILDTECWFKNIQNRYCVELDICFVDIKEFIIHYTETTLYSMLIYILCETKINDNCIIICKNVTGLGWFINNNQTSWYTIFHLQNRQHDQVGLVGMKVMSPKLTCWHRHWNSGWN